MNIKFFIVWTIIAILLLISVKINSFETMVTISLAYIITNSIGIDDDKQDQK